MAWKIERWSKDVFPGHDHVYAKYKDLEPYQLVILSASILDLALAEILAACLRDDPKEQEEFLGLNEDGRAPCGSFGARIQLAYLLGLITKFDRDVFRHMKRLRNIFAHRANVDFRDPKIRSTIQSIYDALVRKLREEGEQPEGEIPFFPSYFREDVHCSGEVLLTVIGIYQLHLKEVIGGTKRAV